MSLHINWIGHACFKLQSPELTVILDPLDKETGYNPPRTTADVVLVSSKDPHHSYVEAVKETPLVFDTPGEYEVKGSLLHGIPSMCSAHRLPNTIFTMRMDGIRLCHLGTLGEDLTDEQIEEIGPVDVLFVPVGIPSCISRKHALRIVQEIEPRIVIPYGFKTGKSTLEGVESPNEFLKDMGMSGTKPVPKALLKAKDLPTEETQVILLDAQG